MLEQRIQSLKQRLREQVDLAKNQTTLGGMYGVMYEFVEIIENDPLFFEFIKVKTKEEWVIEDTINSEYKSKKIDNKTMLNLFHLYVCGQFWHDHYSLFKNAHDYIKMDKCSVTGEKASNIVQDVGLFFLINSEQNFAEKLTKNKYDLYLSECEECFTSLNGLINSNQKLLNELYLKFNEPPIKNDPIIEPAKEEKKKRPNSLKFDKKKSELIVKGITIKIRLKNELPIDHYILEALFENEFWPEEVYYKDIAIERLGYTGYDNQNDWRKFYRACQHLNEKVKKATKNEILDFAIYTSGKKAGVKINDKYLIKSPK